MPDRITTYAEAFDMLNIKQNEKIKAILSRLEKDGRNEKSICFALWRGREKIIQFKGDTRFYSVMENEIRKWSWSKDDPRWHEYNRRKEEEAKAKLYDEERKRKLKEARTQQSINQKYKQKYPGFVYFIQGSTGGAIKIGYAKNVEARLKTLQTGYPDTLVILCAVPASPTNEKYLHEKFKYHKLHGEWFKPVPEIMEFVKKYKIKIPTQDQYKSILEKSSKACKGDIS